MTPTQQRIVVALGLAGASIVAGAARLAMPMQAAPKQGNADRQHLEGIWRGYVVEGKGENPDRGPLKIELVITADKISAKNLQDGNKGLGEGTYRLDATKKLKELDATGAVGPRKSTTYAGIYEINGDTLKWCVDNVNKGRPTEFATRRGQYLLILKRQKT